MDELKRSLFKAILKCLKPLVRILLKHGVSHAEFNELSKRAYFEIAESDFQIPGRKQTTSRISVVTGLARKDVARIKKELNEQQPAKTTINRPLQVVSGWVRDAQFHSEKGRPLALTVEGDSPNFTELVNRYAGDVPVRAVLDELLRVEVVSKNKSGEIRLRKRAFVPTHSKADQVYYLGQSTADLLSTLDYNFSHPAPESRLQLFVAYDNLPKNIAPKFKKYGEVQARTLLGDLDQWLAPHDRDTNDVEDDEGRVRAGMGIYFFEEEIAEEIE